MSKSFRNMVSLSLKRMCIVVVHSPRDSSNSQPDSQAANCRLDNWCCRWMIVASRVFSIHPPPNKNPTRSRIHRIIGIKRTYTGELGTTVTALGSSSSLLDVQSTELTTRGLDNAGEVGGGVVAKYPRSALRNSIISNSFRLVKIRKPGEIKHTGCGGGR